MNMLLWLFLFAVATASLHFGLGMVIIFAVILGAILASLGTFFIVLVFDGDGSPW